MRKFLTFLLPSFSRIEELPGSVHDTLYKERKIKMENKRFDQDSESFEHNKRMDMLRLEFEKFKFSREMESQERQFDKELELRRDEIKLKQKEVELKQLQEQRVLAELLHTKRLSPRRYIQMSRKAQDQPSSIIEQLSAAAKDKTNPKIQEWAKCHALVRRWGAKNRSQLGWVQKPLPSPFELEKHAESVEQKQVQAITPTMKELSSRSVPFASTMCPAQSPVNAWVIPGLMLALLATFRTARKHS